MDSELVAKYATENREQVKETVEKLAETKEGRDLIRTVLNEKDVSLEKIAQARPVLNKAVRGSSGGGNSLLENLSHLETAITAPIMAVQGAKFLSDTFGGPPGNKKLSEVLRVNPKIKERYEDKDIREYWDTLRKHAPNLVEKDPKMAGKILEQFLGYEGANIQALNKVLEAEKKIRDTETSPAAASLTDTVETFNKTRLNKESSPDYEAIKEMANERENGD